MIDEYERENITYPSKYFTYREVHMEKQKVKSHLDKSDTKRNKFLKELRKQINLILSQFQKIDPTPEMSQYPITEEICKSTSNFILHLFTELSKQELYLKFPILLLDENATVAIQLDHEKFDLTILVDNGDLVTISGDNYKDEVFDNEINKSTAIKIIYTWITDTLKR